MKDVRVTHDICDILHLGCTQNLPKNLHLLPSDKHTYVCVFAYQGVRNASFTKKKKFIRTKLKIPIVSISKWREKTWI